MWVSDLGPLRWMVDAVISVEDRVAATARQVGIFVNVASTRPVRMPQALVQKYRARYRALAQ
ncbi:MAG: hypothetical protein M1546_15100 [Chloroflexi bacterium]|nr:hypothetical protein [Chloroflexota bacterium]